MAPREQRVAGLVAPGEVVAEQEGPSQSAWGLRACLGTSHVGRRAVSRAACQFSVSARDAGPLGRTPKGPQVQQGGDRADAGCPSPQRERDLSSEEAELGLGRGSAAELAWHTRPQVPRAEPPTANWKRRGLGSAAQREQGRHRPGDRWFCRWPRAGRSEPMGSCLGGGGKGTNGTAKITKMKTP